MKRYSFNSLFFLIAIVSFALGMWINRHIRSSVSTRYQIKVHAGNATVVDTVTGEEFVSVNRP